MYDNTRSYLSRFSGLILFLLTLAVVAVLVILTIRAARDGNDASTTTVNGTTEDFIIEDTEIDRLNQDADESVGVVTTPDAEQNVDTRDNDSISIAAADDNSETSLPDSNNDASVAGTTTEAVQTDQDTSNSVGTIVATGPAAIELPNTGSTQSMLASIVAVFAVAFAGLTSRRTIVACLRK